MTDALRSGTLHTAGVTIPPRLRRKLPEPRGGKAMHSHHDHTDGVSRSTDPRTDAPASPSRRAVIKAAGAAAAVPLLSGFRPLSFGGADSPIPQVIPGS